MSAETTRALIALVLAVHGIGHVQGVLAALGIGGKDVGRRIRGCSVTGCAACAWRSTR
jgi:hypothetical protein